MTEVQQAHGFIKVEGESDIEFEIGGIGKVDIAEANRGTPARSEYGIQRIYAGHEVRYENLAGTLYFHPYFKVGYLLATSNISVSGTTGTTEAEINGRLRTRVVSDFGNFTANFPLPDEEQNPGAENGNRAPNQVEVFSDNVLYGSSGKGSEIVLGTEISFGMRTRMFQGYLRKAEVLLPDVSLPGFAPCRL